MGRDNVALQVGLEKVRFFAVVADEVFLTSMNLKNGNCGRFNHWNISDSHIHMCFQKLSHEELLPASFELTNEFRFGVIIQMSAQVVHAGEKLSTELAWHVFGSMGFDVLFQC